MADWLAERYLYTDESCMIEFVRRSIVPSPAGPYDCVLDAGRIHDPGRLIFDHKPLAFAHRDEQCASSQVWLHLQQQGSRVDHLRGLVELVHDGDAATRRSGSAAWQASRKRGLHALIRHAAACSENDRMLYQAVAVYLDSIDPVRPLRPETGTPPNKEMPNVEPLKPTQNNLSRILGPFPQPGRRPARPPAVDRRLDQLIDESEKWFRSFCEVWFDADDPLFESAVVTSERKHLPENYDAAILTMRWVTEAGKYAVKALEQGRQEAERKFRDKQKLDRKRSAK